MNSNDIFTILRNARTIDVPLDSTFSNDESMDVTPAMVAAAMLSSTNIDYVTKAVFDKADPLRNSGFSWDIVRAKVVQYLNAWKELGKFDKLKNYKGDAITTTSMASTVLMFDKEFVEAFAQKIIAYDDPTRVTSITNPGGLFAQQTENITFSSRRVPFYERALYKRLNDWNLDLPEDETETPFYVMDRNPNISDKEREKRKPTKESETYLDRVGMSTRMIPHY